MAPGAVPQSSITDDHLRNLDLGIDAALKELDIPKLIEAEEMNSPDSDELANMTYLSYFRDKYNQPREPVVSIDGPKTRQNTLGSPVHVDLSTKHVRPEDLTATFNGTTVRPTDKGNGKFSFDFTPRNVGDDILSIKLKGKPIDGGDITISTRPKPSLALKGTLRDGQVNQPYRFDLSGVNVRPDQIKVKIFNADGGSVHPSIDSTPQGGFNNNDFAITFVPKDVGNHRVQVLLDDEVVPIAGFDINGFFNINIKEEPIDWVHAYCDEPYTIALECKNVSDSDLTSHVIAPNGQRYKASVVVSGPAAQVTFTTPVKGINSVCVLLAGEAIPSTPVKIPVQPKATQLGNKTQNKQGQGLGTVLSLQDYELHGVTSDELTTSTQDEFGRNVDVKTIWTQTGPRTVNLSFIPQYPATYVTQVLFDGKRLHGTDPISIPIKNEATGKVTGSVKEVELHVPFKFRVNTGVACDPERLSVMLTDLNGHATPLTASFGCESDKTVFGEMTPLQLGRYDVQILLDGAPVKGARFPIMVIPHIEFIEVPLKSLLGTPFVFQKMRCLGVHESQIKVTGQDRSGNFPSHFFAVDTRTGLFDLKMLTNVGGYFDVKIFIDDRHVGGLELELPNFKASMPLKALNGEVGKSIDFNISNSNFSSDQVRVNITDDAGRPSNGIVPDVRDSSTPEKSAVSLSLRKAGSYVVTLIVAGRELPGGNFAVNVSNPPPIQTVVSPRAPSRPGNGIVGRLFIFPLNIGGGQFAAHEIQCRASVNGVPTVPCTVEQQSTGLKVQFTPVLAGTHDLEIIIGGKVAGKTSVYIEA